MLRTCAATGALLALASGAAAAGDATRPNIIWVMSDDMGWGEVGLYPAGSTHGRIATPHLDQMGKEGMRFTQAYAGYTVCGPSRTTLFTGRHSGQFQKYGLPGTTLPPTLNVTTTADILKKAGYVTGASGKIAPLTSPTTQGFDHFFGQISQLDCHNMYPQEVDAQVGSNAPHHIKLPHNDKFRDRDLCMAHPAEYNYTTDLFHSDAMQYLETVAGGEDPFFMYLAFTVPHAGGWTSKGAEQGAPVPTDLQYGNEPWPNVERDHAGTITYMDAFVGDLFSNIKRLGIDNDTIVFFASDNGAHLEGGHNVHFFNSTGGLNGHKRSLYEGGVRSPSMVRWPGKIAPGQVSSFQWAFWDAMPTFAELAGVEASTLPKDIDGISIVPTLLGKQQQAHEYVFFTWDGAGELKDDHSPTSSGRSSGYGVRQGNWKGVVPFCSDTKTEQPSLGDASTFMLFDLTTDPFEQTDVSASHQDVVTKMIQFVMSKNLSCKCYQC